MIIMGRLVTVKTGLEAWSAYTGTDGFMENTPANSGVVSLSLLSDIIPIRRRFNIKQNTVMPIGLHLC